jgi:hypothetical protein
MRGAGTRDARARGPDAGARAVASAFAGAARVAVVVIGGVGIASGRTGGADAARRCVPRARRGAPRLAARYRDSNAHAASISDSRG